MRTIRNCGFVSVRVGHATGDPSAGRVSIEELFELAPGSERELPADIPREQIVVYLPHASQGSSLEALDLVEIRDSGER